MIETAIGFACQLQTGSFQSSYAFERRAINSAQSKVGTLPGKGFRPAAGALPAHKTQAYKAEAEER